MKYITIILTIIIFILILTRNTTVKTNPIDQFPEISSYVVLEDNSRCFKQSLTEDVDKFRLGAKEEIICK